MRFLAALLVLATATGGLAETRPNILLILTDDHRWDALGCHGHPFLKTPHLDRLAEEGSISRTPSSLPRFVRRAGPPF